MPLVATLYCADCASFNPVTIVLVPVAPVYVKLIYAVPVVLKLVAVVISNTVVALPLMANCPVPNASVLVLVPELLKKFDVSVRLFKFNVPEVNVVVLPPPFDPQVNASCNVQVPVPLNVNGKSIILPLDVIVCDDDDANVVAIKPEVIMPPVLGVVKLP